MEGRDQGTLSGEKRVNSPSAGPGLDEARIGGSGGFFRRRESCISHRKVNLGGASPHPRIFLVIFTWWPLLFGAKFVPRVHRTLSASLPHSAPQIPARSEGPNTSITEKEVSSLQPNESGMGRLYPSNSPHLPTLTQHPGPLTPMLVPQPTDKTSHYAPPRSAL